MAPLIITTGNKSKHHESKFVFRGAEWYSRGMGTLPNLLNDASPIAMGLRIRRLIEAHGFTVSMFADACGVSQSAVSNWLSGRPPGRPLIMTISRVTGAPANWILSGEGLLPADLWAKILAIHNGEVKPKKPPRKRKAKRP